jgi:hypothetical protein
MATHRDFRNRWIEHEESLDSDPVNSEESQDCIFTTRTALTE